MYSTKSKLTIAANCHNSHKNNLTHMYNIQLIARPICNMHH